MSVLFFIFVIMLSFANAQDYVESNDDDNESNSSGNSTNCIRKYRDLQSYVLNNEDLLDELTELFYKTGEAPTKFVRITYEFQILLSVENHTNHTNITTYYGNDIDDEFSCLGTKEIFIWSSSGLYLLGPKPLFWQTLFAVYVPESSITIHLPCLCNDAYEDLLPRLTYLIKVYPAMQFESQTIQYISPYYFKIKEKDEDKYKSLVTIFGISIPLPWATFLVFSYFAFVYSNKISIHAINYLNETNDNENTDATGNKKRTRRQALKYTVYINCEKDKKVLIAAISVASVLLTVTMFAFHITASVMLIQYGNEVLHNKNHSDFSTPYNEGFESNNEGGSDNEVKLKNTETDNQDVPIVSVVFSFFPSLILVIIAIGKVCYIVYNFQDDKDLNKLLGEILQVSVGGLLVYIGFYFLPYMVLAFINDPIQTVFIYLMAISFILCVYLLTYSSIFFSILLCSDYIDELDTKVQFVVRGSYAVFALGTGLSVVYFLIILILILTLGSYHNFQAVENLTLPIIIALITVFLFKPSYKYIKTTLERIDAAINAQLYIYEPSEKSSIHSGQKIECSEQNDD